MAERTGPDAKTAAFNDLTDAMNRYLEAIGWRALIASGPRIQQQPQHIGSMRYEFVVDFTGAPPPGAQPLDTARAIANSTLWGQGGNPVELTGQIDEHGLYAYKQLEDGRWACVQPLTFGRAQLAVSLEPGPTLHEALQKGFGYDVPLYYYETREAAIAAMQAWDGKGTPIGEPEIHGA